MGLLRCGESEWSQSLVRTCLIETVDDDWLANAGDRRCQRRRLRARRPSAYRHGCRDPRARRHHTRRDEHVSPMCSGT